MEKETDEEEEEEKSDLEEQHRAHSLINRIQSVQRNEATERKKEDILQLPIYRILN